MKSGEGCSELTACGRRQFVVSAVFPAVQKKCRYSSWGSEEERLFVVICVSRAGCECCLEHCGRSAPRPGHTRALEVRHEHVTWALTAQVGITKTRAGSTFPQLLNCSDCATIGAKTSRVTKGA
jgi:hypothetical protein